MRVAVVQLEVETTQRTLTFQRALRAIDNAAEKDPAPDLVLLPCFCDVPAVMTGNLEIIERLAGPTVAGCGVRARQWGVFVSLGIAEWGPERPYATGVLVDRDGDLRLAHRQCVVGKTFRDRFAIGEGVVATDILLGRVAVLTGDDLLDAEAWAAAAEAGAAVILGTTCWASDDGLHPPDGAALREQVSACAKRHGLGCAVADVTTGDGESVLKCPGVSMIVDADGRVSAAAEPWKGTTLWADLDVPPCLQGHGETRSQS